ncbi:MAG: hypothetical protein JSW06_09285 [Thermoplasmatales archaeon]|nr:MAG: hypothetical protein JSW06_09285 [Thermoplasmatales archaeon]
MEEEKNIKKQLVILGIVVLLLAVGLSGCDESNKSLSNVENRIIGTWKLDVNSTNVDLELGMYITFLSNGELISSNGREGGDYEFKEGKLLITLHWYNDWHSSYNYQFSENYTKLYLYNIENDNSLNYFKLKN